MPRFRFPEQWLHPDLPLAHRLFVGFRGVVAPHPIEVGLIEAATDAPALVARRTLGLQRTGVTGCGLRLIDDHPLRVLRRAPWQYGPIRTAIPIRMRLIGEGLLAKEGPPFIKIGQGHIGTDTSILNRDDVVTCAISGIAGHLLQR